MTTLAEIGHHRGSQTVGHEHFWVAVFFKGVANVVKMHKNTEEGVYLEDITSPVYDKFSQIEDMAYKKFWLEPLGYCM